MYRKRIIILCAFIGIAFLILITRLVYLQVFMKSKYSAKLNDSISYIKVYMPARGKIYDTNGKLLACSKRAFDISAIPARVNEVTYANLNSLFGKRICDNIRYNINKRENIIQKRVEKLSPRQKKRKIYDLMNTSYPVIRNIDFNNIAQIDLYPERFPGLVIDARSTRYYPYGSHASHILGYVGAYTKNEYEARIENGYFKKELEPIIGDDGYNYVKKTWGFYGDIVGRAGIELLYNSILKGRRGAVSVERKIHSGEKKYLINIPPKHGNDMFLTIDIELQKVAEDSLGERKGAVILLDPYTGGILALASFPRYNPNEILKPNNKNYIEQIMQNKDKPFLNRAIQGQYPLGSVFKIVTGIAALKGNPFNSKKMPFDKEYECNGSFYPITNKYPFRCWIANARGGSGRHGYLDITGGLMHSCNVFFFHAGREYVGAEGFAYWGKIFGLGSKTNIDLPSELPGNYPLVRAGTNDDLNLAIGQGGLAVTPVQVAKIISAIANGGEIIRPHIKKTNKIKDTPQVEMDLMIEDSILKQIKDGLYGVVNDPQGTAYRSELRYVRGAGKTGTAQVVSSSELAKRYPKKYAPHAWFAGYAPYDNPEVAFVVLVEHGASGSHVAGPIAKQILQAYFAMKKEKEKNEKVK